MCQRLQRGPLQAYEEPGGLLGDRHYVAHTLFRRYVAAVGSEMGLQAAKSLVVKGHLGNLEGQHPHEGRFQVI